MILMKDSNSLKKNIKLADILELFNPNNRYLYFVFDVVRCTCGKPCTKMIFLYRFVSIPRMDKKVVFFCDDCFLEHGLKYLK